MKCCKALILPPFNFACVLVIEMYGSSNGDLIFAISINKLEAVEPEWAAPGKEEPRLLKSNNDATDPKYAKCATDNDDPRVAISIIDLEVLEPN